MIYKMGIITDVYVSKVSHVLTEEISLLLTVSVGF